MQLLPVVNCILLYSCKSTTTAAPSSAITNNHLMLI